MAALDAVHLAIRPVAAPNRAAFDNVRGGRILRLIDIFGIDRHAEEQKNIEEEKRSSEEANMIPDSPQEPFGSFVNQSNKNGFEIKNDDSGMQPALPLLINSRDIQVDTDVPADLPQSMTSVIDGERPQVYFDAEPRTDIYFASLSQR